MISPARADWIGGRASVCTRSDRPVRRWVNGCVAAQTRGVRMIERRYGTLLDSAMESLAARLDAPDATRDEFLRRGENVNNTTTGQCVSVSTALRARRRDL